MNPFDLVSSGIQGLGLYFILVNLLPSIILVFFIYLAVTLGPFVIYDTNSFENKLFVNNNNNNLNFTYVNEKIIEFGKEENLIPIIFGIIILSIIMVPLQLVIIRLFEGYWPKIFYPFTIIGKWMQKNKFDNIQNEEDKELEKIDEQDNEKKKEIISKYHLKRILSYPDPEDKRILPTGLGNILRAAEDLVPIKYGLDAIITWTRLYIFLPDNIKTLLNDQRTKLDLSTRLSFIFLISTIISSLFFVKISLLSLIPIATFILFIICYKGSKQVAFGYGQLIHTAFDLYRFDLLKQLKVSLPKNIEEEKKKGQEISSFLAAGEGLPENFEYEPDSGKESKKDSKNESN
jgi:hypothetical protein